MEFKVSVRDLVEFLLYKIENDICTDEEYGLYIDYCKYGKKVFKYSENEYIVKRLICDYKTYYEEGDNI